MDCVTDAAATWSLHTQTCNFLCYVSLSCYIHPPRDGCYRLPDERVVWTAWRLRDWWCCLTRAVWFCTAWLMLLPHQACTLSPQNGFSLIRCWCMNCVTTAWLMLLCLFCLYCIATAWLMLLSHVRRPLSGGSGPASADTRLRDCWWCLTPCLTESAAVGCLIVLNCLDCVTGGAVARTGAIWAECVTTAWLMLQPHPACTSSLIYNVPGFCRQSRRDDCVNAAAGWMIVYC